MQTKPKTFVIGDVHGHHERLVDLLIKANIIEPDSLKRIDPDVEVIQLGDLGQWDWESKWNDEITVDLAQTLIDTQLWGNHDYAIVNHLHQFRGYAPPTKEVIAKFQALDPKFAVIRHGHLITHAGLHPAYIEDGQNPLDVIVPGKGVVDHISSYRGGFSMTGGILWRDFLEAIWDGMPQIFGHSRQDEVFHHQQWWCIDIGKKDGGALAGIWLPSLEVVTL